MFHNPSCSKSRGALEILREQGIETDVVEYLKAPPDRATLERIVDAIPNPPGELVRKDKRFKELGLDRGRLHDPRRGRRAPPRPTPSSWSDRWSSGASARSSRGPSELVLDLVAGT